MGPTTYATLRDLFAPTSQRKIPGRFQCLRHHFETKRAIIVERFYFHKHNQTGGESIAKFDAALRKLTTHCGFAGYLEEALRDRFVCGLRDEAIQRLLSEKNLTLAKAMDLALSMEAAEKNLRPVRREDAPSIKTVQGPTRPKFGSRHPQQACTRCGRSNHPQRTANSRKLRATHVRRKATSHQPAVLSLQQSRQPLRGDAQANHIELMWCSKKLRLPPMKKDYTCSSCRHQPPQPPLRPSK